MGVPESHRDRKMTDLDGEGHERRQQKLLVNSRLHQQSKHNPRSTEISSFRNESFNALLSYCTTQVEGRECNLQY